MLPKSLSDLIEQSEQPVLVDFWAEWCGPCHTVAPVIAQIAREYKGRLVVVKVNVDQKPAIAAQYQIQSIPTIMIFKGGRSLARQSGALPYGALKQMGDGAIAPA
jgi:thioredoxin